MHCLIHGSGLTTGQRRHLELVPIGGRGTGIRNGLLSSTLHTVISKHYDAGAIFVSATAGPELHYPMACILLGGSCMSLPQSSEGNGSLTRAGY